MVGEQRQSPRAGVVERGIRSVDRRSCARHGNLSATVSAVDVVLALPRKHRHARASIDECEWRVRRFVEHDAYVPYDYWITTLSLPPNTITPEHVRAINDAMRARSPIASWQPIIGQIASELADIPLDL